MKKYLIITVILSMTAILYGSIANYSDLLKSPDIIEIDNSIIIGGLIMESDEVYDSEDQPEKQGEILYDNYFDDTVIEFESLSRKQRARTELEKLRAKDKRWHLKKYKVRKGDTIGAICSRSGISEKNLLAVNSKSRGDILKTGSSILIPTRAGVYHKVKKGESVSGIASAYGISAKAISEQNGLSKKGLKAGSRIFIPGGTALRDKPERCAADERVTAKNKISGGRHPISLIWPLRGKITSSFGYRKDPFTGKRSFHNGMDISANAGTPVLAAASGTVIFSGWKHGYGNMVVIRHDKGYITVYAHNTSNIAQTDKTVKRGERIALSGMTGAVTGAHLHFELRKIDRLTPLNPMRFIKP